MWNKLKAWLKKWLGIPEVPPAPEPPSPPPPPPPPVPTPEPVPPPEPVPVPSPPVPAPIPPPPDFTPPSLSEVVWLDRNVADWAVNSFITEVRWAGERICVDHTMAGKWPTWVDEEGIVGEGNIWVFAKVGTVWYASTCEWLKKGQICKRLTASGEWGIGAHTKNPPLETWVPLRGEWVGFMMSSRARDDKFVAAVRSDIAWVQWLQEDA